MQVAPEIQLLNQTADNLYRPFERLGSVDIFKYTDQGMADLVGYLCGCEVLGAGLEGLVFMDIQAERVIKVLHEWAGASEFFQRLADSHSDERCKQGLTENNPFGMRLVADRDTMQSSISKINRRNWLHRHLPENILPVDSVFAAPNNQVFAYTSTALKDAEWLNWWELTAEEQAVFRNHRHFLDTMGDGNFARCYVSNSDGTVSSRIIANDIKQ